MDRMSAAGEVVAVSRDAAHAFSKHPCDMIRLLAGLGVEGDAHQGRTVQHRSRVREDPTRPNLRQVHLLHEELFEELRHKGFHLGPGAIGENITTRSLDLLALPRGARLHIGGEALIEVTGLRNPCRQLDAYRRGLMAAVMDKDGQGRVIRKAGVMGIVLVGGDIRPGDPIRLALPSGGHRALEPV